jgi:hypothetical protein
VNEWFISCPRYLPIGCVLGFEMKRKVKICSKRLFSLYLSLQLMFSECVFRWLFGDAEMVSGDVCYDIFC